MAKVQKQKQKQKQKRRKVASVWLGHVRHKPQVDLLRDLCGVDYYDLDFQEVNVDDKRWREQAVKTLVGPISYSESFIDAVVAAAKDKGIAKALYVIVQYDFTYDPKKAKRKVASDPVFLGVFDYDDKGEGVELEW
jgi:Immunity protein 22